MARVEKIKEINVSKQNKIGLLADISKVLAGAGINITAICAYVIGDSAEFRLTTNNNQKAIATLKEKDYKIAEKDAVKVALENRVGALEEIGKKLAAANIDLDYIYGTVTDSAPATIIFSSNNDGRALEALK